MDKMNLLYATAAVSGSLSFDQTLAQLTASAQVDGIAEFGSRTTDHGLPTSDYDLLILVKQLPARVFQLVTTIDRKLADVVLADKAARNNNLTITIALA